MAAAFYSHINLSVDQINEVLRIVPGDTDLDDVHNLSEIARSRAEWQHEVDTAFDDLRSAIEKLREGENRHVMLFGLFTPSLHAKFVEADDRREEANTYVFESFSRHDENNDFQHLSWKLTGRYHLEATGRRSA